jgi:hypothetical protein
MLGQSVNQSEDENFEVERGPLFTAGVLVLAYGLLRRRGLAIGAGLGAIWLDQRSEFGHALNKRFESALKKQIKAHAHSAPDATRGAEPADAVVPRPEWGAAGRPQ